MPGHDDVGLHVGCVHPQVGDQRLGEAPDRELGCAAGGAASETVSAIVASFTSQNATWHPSADS